MTYPNNSNTFLPGTIQIPSSAKIVAATNSNPMQITVVFNPITQTNTYIAGQLISLFIPYNYGMWQANGLTARILNVSGTDFTLDVDSRGFDPFVVPATGTPAVMSPSGSQNLAYDNTTNQLPFQSLNNRGN
jgi:hypothetical protein